MSGQVSVSSLRRGDGKTLKRADKQCNGCQQEESRYRSEEDHPHEWY